MEEFNRRCFIKLGAAMTLSPYLPTALAREAPISSFTPDATAEQVTQGIDLTGKTIVVTGCNSGLGYETMRVLALRGAHVIGTARSAEKGQQACSSVKGRATPVVLELSDFNSVVQCAEQIRAMNSPIDALICNAGILLNDWQQKDGLELQFVVNHLGHFLLTNRLLDKLIAAPQGRVVVVGSISHKEASAGIQFDDLSGKEWARSAYGHSKLANGLFSLELSRRLRATNATSNSLNPGGTATNILRHFDNPQTTGGFKFKTPAVGAATSCYLASHPALSGVSGYYFHNCNPTTPGKHQLDAAMATRLWQVSEELTHRYRASA